ncbi:MAG: hypothetical protein R3F50_10075 [Gammaproteobacteria bacterium]|jgi:hypothetical protein
MSELTTGGGKSRLPIILGGGLGGLVVAAVLGFMIYSSICPCERTPGGFLFGERPEQPVSDWSFANQVELCQIQIWAGIRPHSINLNCMATPDGNLYLSCSVCDTKYWAARVGENEQGRLRLNGVVYPIVLNRVTDPAEMDRAWQARDAKLNSLPNPVGAPTPGAPRAERWWTYRIEYAS